ncbi:hypothetical protein [Sedimentibacter sp.]|uniref:hypothetical protein n=1 Tax=Sedimentibacter sp. TaxID=1960295 RepID=UPI0028A93572|nr:hypothetical protein [Sedimentibacter sp.]
MELEKILGTNTVKENLMVSGRNFTKIENESGGNVELHNLDETAHPDIRQQINSLIADSKKYAKFSISANQSIPHSTTTQVVWSNKVSYNGEDFCEIDAETGQIKITKEGMYEINCGIVFATLATGTQVGLRNIWTDYLQTFMPASGSPTYLYNSYFKYCTVGTLLNLRVSQTQGTAVDISPSGTGCSVRKVG